MIKLKKIICHASFGACIITTIYILLEIYMAETAVAVSDMLVRYVSAIIIGFIFEKYLMIFKFLPSIIPNNRKYHDIKESNSITGRVWIRAVFFYGALYFGLGLGTFLLFSMKFICNFSNIDLSAVVFTYIVSIIGGFITVNLIFFILLAISRKKWKSKVLKLL
ncbi:MAG: hypothetical protein LBK00_05730 [Treponema sp.]|jgi:hypothetical protein|nr:hypothetical protein [Treponema sp.]